MRVAYTKTIFCLSSLIPHHTDSSNFTAKIKRLHTSPAKQNENWNSNCTAMSQEAGCIGLYSVECLTTQYNANLPSPCQWFKHLLMYGGDNSVHCVVVGANYHTIDDEHIDFTAWPYTTVFYMRIDLAQYEHQLAFELQVNRQVACESTKRARRWGLGSTLFLHGVCMLRECIYGECAHGQHVRITLTLTLTLANTITAVLSKWKCRTCAHTHLCN